MTTFSNPKLSDRIRMDIDAAGWVVDGVEALEQQLSERDTEVKLLREALTEYVKADTDDIELNQRKRIGMKALAATEQK